MGDGQERQERQAAAEQSDRSPHWFRLACGLGAVLTVVFALHYRQATAENPHSVGQGLPLDDAWIHAQFAQNAAHGEPFQYNPGTLSSGSTAPLWSLIEGAGLAIHDDPVAVAHLLGVAFTIALMCMAVALARRLGLAGPSLLAVPALLACQWQLAWAALSGMEIPLVAFLVLLCFWLYLGERALDRPAWRSGLAAGLLVWGRPEGLLAGGVIVADQLLLLARTAGGAEGRRGGFRRLAGFVGALSGVVLPLFAINALAGPGIFPQTVYTKAHAVPWTQGWHLFWSFFLELSVDHLAWHIFFIGAAGYAMARTLLTWRDARGGGAAVMVLFVVAFVAGIAFFRGSSGQHSRYLLPCLPLLVLLGILGLDRAAHALIGRRGSYGLAAAVIALVVTGYPVVMERADVYALNVASVSRHVVAMGRWTARHVPPEATVAMSDVGAMSYFTSNPVVDMRGLVSPWHGWDRLAELERQRRDQVAYAMLFPELNERVILRGDYIPLHAISLDANNISATDNLVAYRTPWADGRELQRLGPSFDFEDGTNQGWMGELVLSQPPVELAGPGQRRVVNLGGGRYFMSSWGSAGDEDRGRAISPEFLLEGDIMTFRIGGGELPGEVGLRLWVDRRVVRTAVGDRSEVLIQREWDLRDLRGHRARLELFDEASGAWGHVMLDEVRQYRVVGGPAPALRDLRPEGPQESAESRRAAEERGLLPE